LNVNNTRADAPNSEHPTVLEQMDLPFVLEDDLVDPLPASVVIRIICDEPIGPHTVRALTAVLADWLVANARVADRLGAKAPEGEAVQVGEQTVEFQILGAQGRPDDTLGSMLDGLARVSRTRQEIVQVEMD
jgi:hypothetical protein